MKFDEEKLSEVYAKQDKIAGRATKATRQAEYDKLAVLEELLTSHTAETLSASVEDGTLTKQAVDWFNKNIKNKVVNQNIKKGSLFEVDVPENDVLLDEDKPFNEQPEKVQKALRSLAKKENIILDDLISKGLGGGYSKNIFGRNIYENLCSQLSKKTGVWSEKEVSHLLNEYGIKGITYDGGTDGRCFVVFDDKAVSVIERYNQETRKSIELGSERLRKDIAAWGKLTDAFDADKGEWARKNNGKLYDFMDVPLVMQLVGVPFNKLQVYGSFFAHSIRDTHPGMSLDIVKQLPAAMTNPLMITKGNKPNSYVFALEVKTKQGANVVVPVEIEKQDDVYGTISVANSAFAKTKSQTDAAPKYSWFSNALRKNEIIYINKEKSTSWVQTIRHLLPSVGPTLLSSALSEFIVANKNSPVKTESDLSRLQLQHLEMYQTKSTPKGSISFSQTGQRLISLFETADQSTFLHEMSHLFLLDLEQMAGLRVASTSLAEIIKPLWIGRVGSLGKWTSTKVLPVLRNSMPGTQPFRPQRKKAIGFAQ